jgi:hypothetical protein
MAGGADTVRGVGDQAAEVSSDQGNAKLVLLGRTKSARPMVKGVSHLATHAYLMRC